MRSYLRARARRSLARRGDQCSRHCVQPVQRRGEAAIAPLASGAMLDMALGGGVLGPAGANGLPFVVVGGAATLAAAVPLVALPRLEQTKGE